MSMPALIGSAGIAGKIIARPKRTRPARRALTRRRPASATKSLARA